MIDLYPTRKLNRESIHKRLDPVVIKEGSINSGYSENGFLVYKNFFSKSDIINCYFDSCNAIREETSYKVTEPFSNKIRSILNIHLMENIKAIALNKRLGILAKSILGDGVYIHQSRINYKDGKDSTGWSIHSDFETWHSQDGMPRMKCFTAMIPLCENTQENGCLKVIPGSHNYFCSARKEKISSPENNFADQKEGVPSKNMVDEISLLCEQKAKNVICDVGDLVIFDCNLLHFSEKNRTDKKRINLYLVLNSLNNKLQNAFSYDFNRPEEMGIRENIFQL